ncbi:hypothetical protein RND71_013047 [Anisodus tanguticus]|uniref:SAM domain-containing protein n=1 Tax=Anisodus tanguticus TaxID=243964 RepID=A0AAE1SFS6_9SOLA|nr:hypothetical protein RND71_013047 [Anisodus tanguticus]
MDWYSWLSKTSLDQTLTHEYGLVFSINELQKEDLMYFNHEFLQSMGIMVAKHRLEILKLARKEGGTTTSSSNGLSRLVLAINKTKKLLAKNFSKLSFHRASTHLALSELKPYRTQWTGGALKKLKNNNNNIPNVILQVGSGALKKLESSKAIVTTRSMMKSGPLDRRMQDNKLMVTSRNLSISGPLDGKVQERLIMYPNRSPMKSGPLDRRYKDSAVYPSRSNKSGPLDAKGFSPRLNHYNQEMIPADDGGVYSQWSLMFQDMKPT